MQRTIAVSVTVLGVVLLVLGGYGVWSHIEEMRVQLHDLDSEVLSLRGELDLTLEEAETAARRAEEADRVAALFEERARQASTRAEASEAAADAERHRANEAQNAAEEALRTATSAQAEARSAKEERDRSDQERIAAQRAAEEAELEAWRERRRVEELERRQARDLDRLERALGRLAETRRTALGVVMNLGDSIEFDFDQAELRPEARELLSRIAGVLLTAQDFGIQVYGHTDDVGSEQYNLELSERRAAAVRDYLLEAGIGPDQIAMKGFGKGAPLVEGTDETARQRNRRVEIAVVQVSEDAIDVLN